MTSSRSPSLPSAATRPKTSFSSRSLSLKIYGLWKKWSAASRGITLVVGFVDADGDIYNAAAIIHDGRQAGVYHKMFLPNYGVFDENRYFRAGNECPIYVIAGINIGINICEDIWYESGPVDHTDLLRGRCHR